MESIPPRSAAGNISWRRESRKSSPTARRNGLRRKKSFRPGCIRRLAN
jgi:hypothetical protein